MAALPQTNGLPGSVAAVPGRRSLTELAVRHLLAIAIQLVVLIIIAKYLRLMAARAAQAVSVNLGIAIIWFVVAMANAAGARLSVWRMAEPGLTSGLPGFAAAVPGRRDLTELVVRGFHAIPGVA